MSAEIESFLQSGDKKIEQGILLAHGVDNKMDMASRHPQNVPLLMTAIADLKALNDAGLILERTQVS